MTDSKHKKCLMKISVILCICIEIYMLKVLLFGALLLLCISNKSIRNFNVFISNLSNPFLM